jgi:hypothetical protein
MLTCMKYQYKLIFIITQEMHMQEVGAALPRTMEIQQ